MPRQPRQSTAVLLLLLVTAAVVGWFWPVAEGDAAPSAVPTTRIADAPEPPPRSDAVTTTLAPTVEPAREAVATPPEGDATFEIGGTLVGRVLDQAERPIASAVVVVLPTASPATVSRTDTDADGWFRIDWLPPGNYRVRATAAGFATATTGSLRVLDGETTQVELLHLAPGCTLRGIVVGNGDEPIAGADVRVGGQTTASDGSGRFEVAHLPLGPCSVEVRAIGWLGWHQDGIDPARELRVALAAGLTLRGTVVDATTDAPLVRYAVRAVRLQSLRDAQQGPPGWQLRHRIERLSQNPPGRDTATIAANDRAIAEYRARLAALQSAAPPKLRAAADPGPFVEHAEGRFELDRLDEGLYLVEVTSPDHVFARTEPIQLQSGAVVPLLRIAMRSGMVMNGTVTTVDGVAIEGARLQLILPGPPPPATRLGWLVGATQPAGDIVADAVSDRAGGFALPCVPPGDYSLLAIHADHCTTSARATSGAGSTPAHVSMRPRPALRGRVAGIPDARAGEVTVFALGGASNLRSCRVDDLGQYSFERLEPGEYCIRATLGDHEVFVANLLRALFAAESPPPRDVLLGPGERRTFDFVLPLPPTGILQGTVATNGVPAVGYRVALHLPDAARPLTTTTDAAGTFALRDVPAGEGELRIVVRANGSQELWREKVAVTAGTVTTVQPVLSCGALAGRAIASDGAPPSELVGDLLLLPGCTTVPQDLASYRRTNRVHQVSVRAGTFRADTLTSGRAVAILRLRNRESTVTSVDVVAGALTEAVLAAGALRR